MRFPTTTTSMSPDEPEPALRFLVLTPTRPRRLTMHLTTVWFLLIAVLWGGYFFLEGFDFGVGMLLPILGRHPRTATAMLGAIGPLWDGNEVWVLVAGGATFAAFPEWYASLFSGFYLALLLILLGLILRGVALEYRHKSDDPTWVRRWDVCIVVGSALPALLWGVAFANIVHGVPLNQTPLHRQPADPAAPVRTARRPGHADAVLPCTARFSWR